MRPALSAAWPLNVAIASVIETEWARAGSNLSTRLDDPPVYSGEVPQGAALTVGRIVLSGSQENDAPGTFTRIGMMSIEGIEIWTANTSKKTCLEIVAELRALLHRTPLVVAGYGTVIGSFELIISMEDPDRHVYHGSARYTAYSLNPT
jgi:hypothetical protein